MKPNSIIPLFSTPLYHTQSEYVMDTKEFNKLENIEWLEPDLSVEEYRNISVVSKSQSFFRDYNFKRVKDIIIKHKDFYVDEILGIKNNFEMTQSWVARTKKGSSHPAHDHKNCIFSIVYYARCDSGDLVITTKDNFISKKWNFDFNYKFTRNIFNCTSYTCKVKTGDIVILPGHIEHFTTPNESDFERYIIGANYFVSGKLGDDKKVTKMELKINE